MHYELVLHPDVSRRLSTLGEEPREAVTAALDALAREGHPEATPDVVATFIRGLRGERFRVQLSYDDDAKAVHVLSLRAHAEPTRH